MTPSGRENVVAVRGYVSAVAASAAALAITFSLSPVRARPYLLPAIALTVSAWIGGFGPALVSTAIAIVGVNIYLASAGAEPWGPIEALGAILFAIVGGLIASFARARAASEAAIRRQGSHLEAMFGQASVGIGLVGLDGRLRRVNRRMAEIVGRSVAETQTLSTAALTHPDDVAATGYLLRRVGAGELPEVAFDQRYLRPDRSPVWVHVSVAPLLAGDGRPEGLIAVVDDIGERRDSDERLRSSEERYRSLIDASTAIVWTADATGRFVPPQESWQASTGQGPAEYEGWGWSAAIHIEDRGRIQRLWRAALEEATPIDTEARLWSAATGEHRWYSARAVPRRNAAGAIEEWVGACTDIHERRLTEIQLRESEERARVALDIGRLGTWTWLPPDDEVFADARCREIAGLPAEGPLHLADLQDRTHAEDRDRVAAALAQAHRASQPYAEEFRFVHHDGSVRWVVARGEIATRPAAAAPVQVLLGSMMDVTERRLAEEALRAADREKDDFLALLAHELRNPLAPIRTAVQILKTRTTSEEDGRRLFSVIDRQIQHLVRMVDDLLDVSRVLRGKVELRLSPIDIAEVVAIAVETSRPLVDAQRQELLVQLPERPVAVHGDHVRLAQVISNLLNNASKYTDKGGAISLTALAHGGDALVKVTDTGVGIAPDLLPRIFEPFVQADRSLERTRGGLGIGLTLVKKIIELHGGQVSASSRGAGLGSEFVVRLPMVHPALTTADPAPVDALAAVSAPARILVVDDNTDAAESLAMLLRSSGHTVALAHDGMQALQQLDAWPADIVVLDVGLPGMSGYEVAAHLRQRGDACPDLIAVTGYGQASDARRALDAGFRHHLVKPVDAADLHQTIARCVRSRDRRTSRANI